MGIAIGKINCKSFSPAWCAGKKKVHFEIEVHFHQEHRNAQVYVRVRAEGVFFSFCVMLLSNEICALLEVSSRRHSENNLFFRDAQKHKQTNHDRRMK